MKTFATAVAAALLSATGVAAFAVPAAAQNAPSIGVVNVQLAAERSNAYTTAMQQIQTTYAAQIQQANQRRTAIQTELAPQVQAFQQAQAAANPNQQQLAQQYQAIQQRQQAGQREIAQIIQPAALAQAYVEEQIGAQIEAAIDRVMTRRRLTIILRPEATVKASPTVDVTQDVTTELNTALPAVSITPPAGWQPGGQQAPAAPAAPQQQGR